MRKRRHRTVSLRAAVVLLGAVCKTKAIECSVPTEESANLSREYTAEGLNFRVPEIVDYLRNRSPSVQRDDLVNLCGLLPEDHEASSLSEADKEASRSLVLENITIENRVREFRHELQCRA
jgi:hypothetical protein